MIGTNNKKSEEQDVAGYTVNGSPITKESLRKRLKAASHRVKSVDFLMTSDQNFKLRTLNFKLHL